ncbi:MAG TPA: chemotaxis-specific protein-glutamate methyltransferase CheB [Kofleriaceae bacterium]|nr:chemotaxis-specific protein-glutamate methyltransferase CheB [Kofleriaceae bacterium]
MIRVLIVEDSISVRERLREVVESDPELELVGAVGDGRSAIAVCARTRPDVITMDMMLPEMTGLEATEHIMAHQPTPILIVSSSTNRGELFRTYDALAAGAIDVLEKPRGDEPEGVWEAKFLSTVKLISRVRVITHPRARLGSFGRTRPATPGATPASTPESATGGACDVLAIGASTGGPGAVATVLAGLPSALRVPIIVVIHIGELFAATLGEWLDTQAGGRKVVPAVDGKPVADFTGCVVMAPGGHHLTVRDHVLRFTSEAPRHSCRPSVDVLFESVARDYGSHAAGVLLTGMGRDGASGLLDMRRAGGLTVAQDERSCVVYGMPREAAVLGAAQLVLPLTEIAGALGQRLRPGRGGAR